MGILVMKSILSYSLFIAIFSFSLGLGLQQEWNETNRFALLPFKAQINQDPHQVMSSWNESTHFCQWHGVTCGRRHRQRVTALDLQSQNLGGSISPHIGFLVSLLLPSIISGLQTFDVTQNQLQGSVPSNFDKTLPNLLYFSIGANQFTGSIHLSISNATSLVDFVVADNKLTGGVPNLQKLHNLQKFSIFPNQLESNEPGDLRFVSDLTNATELIWCIFSDNNFEGTLPASISNLSKLEILQLTKLGVLYGQDNELTGSIPLSLGNLTKLTELTLQRNNLQGGIPLSLGECHGLLELDLSQNNLDGKLDFSDNRLSGNLPSSLGSCVSLEVLHLQGNFFNGTIPSSMSSLGGIQDLDLSRNNLSGEIPQFLEGFRGLKKLNLSFNEFWGAVPVDGVFKNATATSVVGNSRLCGGIEDLRLSICNSNETKGRALGLCTNEFLTMIELNLLL
ncbi:putative receptor-like protein kinase At3g47110 [Pyrus x bretschneideri]|uniref:putative receptor-like protein kinase At3g47110 n=1 Tax=Pyrus x bretschneideri TaxID=225117 RepID=UPI00202F850B|nr:putative receptor-like protein kinase At3g47110 [Pyrus x bretschneideri]